MRKLKLLLMSGLILISQQILAQKTVTGKVTNSKDGTPLIGASIIVKGSKGVATDKDGVFSLVIPENVTTLSVSMLGYVSQEVPVTSSYLAIELKEGEAQNLDEVVVIGFGSKLKKDLTGNIAKIKGSEVANTPVSNLNQAIQGRAAGVFVEANNGKVGEGVQVRIRGSGSLSASNSPLYVVDGVPLNGNGLAGNSLADINFNEVESFEILKDASAAAIYGSRAANGVVLITTKKGRAGRTAVTANVQYGFNKPTGYRGFLDAQEYIDLLREAAINSDHIEGIDPLDPAQYPGSWLEFAERRLTRYSGYSDWRTLQTNTNWEKLAFNPDARTKIVDISASGGDQKTKFYASGGYNSIDGILVANNFQRFSGRLNLEHNATDRLSFGINMGLSRSLSNRVNDDNQFSTPMQLVALSPVTPPRDLNGVLYDRPVTTYYNGLINVEDASWVSTTYRNIGNAFVNYKFGGGLSFRSEFGIDLQSIADNYFAGSRTESASTNGYGSFDTYKAFNYNTNNYFTYARNFAKNHDVELTAGMAFGKVSIEQSSVTGEDFPVDALRTLASAGRITGGSSSITDASFVSYFVRANYKFKDKYLLNVSGRVDGSSRFGKENKYGIFPAVSAGWILTQEQFLSDVSWLSFLKIRASYGLTGNADGFGDFAQLGLYGPVKYNNQSGLAPTQLSNPDLKWEKSEQVDIGIDFGFFNNRLTGEIDYYKRKTRDLIYNVPVPGTSGFSTQTVNVGSMDNKGYEFVLNSVNISNRAVTWNSSLNISYNQNKILRLDGDQTSIPGNDGRYLNSLIVGQPIGVFYGPKFAGADPANGDALYYLADGKSTTNDYNAAADFVVGNPNPDWIAGLTNSISFKGIELSVLFQGVFGNQILNGAGGFMSASFDWFDNQTRDQLKRWQNPGDITMVPQLRLGYGNGIGASSRYIENGSYVRLKNVTLAYNLPATVMNRLRIRSARIFVTGINLATFTKYTGWDPEVNTDYRASNRNQGSDFYAAPQIKSVTFGINFGF